MNNLNMSRIIYQKTVCYTDRDVIQKKETTKLQSNTAENNLLKELNEHQAIVLRKIKNVTKDEQKSNKNHHEILRIKYKNTMKLSQDLSNLTRTHQGSPYDLLQTGTRLIDERTDIIFYNRESLTDINTLKLILKKWL